MTSWPIFHGPLTSDFGQIIKVEIFVQGRISRHINGSKLIVHMRMYLHETSRIIQEPWPHDLYIFFCWLQILANFPWLRFLSQVDSWALLMVASWYFTSGFTSVRPAASAFAQEFMLRRGARGLYLGQHRFCLIYRRLVDGWILYLGHRFSVTQTLIWKYVCRSVSYISCTVIFFLYLEENLMGKSHNWDKGSMWCKDLPH